MLTLRNSFSSPTRHGGEALSESRRFIFFTLSFRLWIPQKRVKIHGCGLLAVNKASPLSLSFLSVASAKGGIEPAALPPCVVAPRFWEDGLAAAGALLQQWPAS